METIEFVVQKSLTPAQKKKEKLVRIESGESKSIDEETRTLTAIASTESRDAHGDVIHQDGWELKRFNKNPVIIFGHNYYGLAVVGQALKVWIDKKKMYFQMKFAETEFANSVFQLFKEGALRAFSVGFIPKEWKDKEDSEGNRIRHYTKQELLEISAVPVPSNPDAVRLAVKKGLVSKDFEEEFLLPTTPKVEDIDDDEEESEKKTAQEKLVKAANLLEKNHEITKKYRKAFEKLRKLFNIEPQEDEEQNIECTVQNIYDCFKTAPTPQKKRKKKSPSKNPLATPKKKKRKARTASQKELDSLVLGR